MGGCDSCFELFGNGSGNRGREGVADLAVGSGLFTHEFPVFGEALDAGGHGDGEAGKAFEVAFGGGVAEALAIDSEFGPGGSGAGGAEVGSAVFFGATYQSGGDGVGLFLPSFGSFPAVFSHEVVEGFSDGWWEFAEAEGPVKVRSDVLAEGDDDDTGAELADSEVRGVEKLPVGAVAHAGELGFELGAVFFEVAAEKATHVFKHHGFGIALFDEAEGFREEVAFVVFAKLFACDGKWGAGYPASEEVDAVVSFGFEVTNVLFDHVPLRAVVAKSGTRWGIDFDESFSFKACLF